MSFRNTYITNFLYKANSKHELDQIENVLSKYGTVNWQGGTNEGSKNLGYFHGVIKDLDGYQTKSEESEIISAINDLDLRVEIKIVFE